MLIVCDGLLLSLVMVREEKMKNIKIITSESVNIGHPDKTCDVIADAFLDEALKQDPFSQMAVECAIKNNKLFIYGEATTKAKLDYHTIAQDVLAEIGYKNKFDIVSELSQQSPEISNAVLKAELSANDQGIVFGYATNETKEFMPLPIMVAHKLMKRYDDYRRQGEMFFADAKSQVSVVYENDRPVAFDNILISVSHSENLSHEQIEQLIKTNVIDVVLEEYKPFVKKETKFIINPSGKFTIWGSFGDSGCVGRKIVVDTYGGVGHVGGGCFSSKNATKVDRSGAYFARYIAKSIVANGLAKRCEVGLGFAIGVSKPVSVFIETFGTNTISVDNIYKIVENNFNLSVANMIEELDLLKPIYKKTACFGHFGREEFNWEKVKELI
jgi:S-adenosylmethionine synthetase